MRCATQSQVWKWLRQKNPLSSLTRETVVIVAYRHLPLISSGLCAGRKSQQNIDGLVQDCNISIANAPEILQSCTEPLVYAVCHENYARGLHFVVTLVCWRLVPLDYTHTLQSYSKRLSPCQRWSNTVKNMEHGVTSDNTVVINKHTVLRMMMETKNQ